MPIPSVERPPIQWTHAEGANLYSTGASGPAPVRPVHPANAVESVDKLGEGVTVNFSSSVRQPEKPSDASNKDLDWTARQDQQQLQKTPQAEKEDEQNKEPISVQLIEHIQSMWRASAMAVEAAEIANRTDQHERNAMLVRTEPLTYSEPKVKRTGSSGNL